eukprot:TRINITY_DN15136_c0_g1_i1.p1 TRINITY_DN15136_c0_g1~~TRINITY_DN15136_c0_g1_i1.p1  ORF type:complete len:197 (+),score=23.47 TRINITY_DN15136_c0_g1_i1:210-800(+)
MAEVVQPLSPHSPTGPVTESYAHPGVAFFHIVFKGAALAWYLLCGWFTNSFIVQFVITVLLVAFDFWTVKNVSGRILVGLRWWNEVNENGESIWRFESLDKKTLDAMNKKDTWLFWWSLYAIPAVWLALGIIAIIKLKFDYLLVVAIALSLGTANIIGFTKCRKDAKNQFQKMAGQAGAMYMASSAYSSLKSVMGG